MHIRKPPELVEVPKPRENVEPMTTLIGRLCADPVLRQTKSGKAVSTIRLAVNPPEGDATFHSVVLWERTAEAVCKYLSKGRAVEVVGRVQERNYEAQDGTKRSVEEIVAWRVRFLSSRDLKPESTPDEVA